MKRIWKLKNRSLLIRRLLVANIVIVSLLCISAKRAPKQKTRQQTLAQAHDTLSTLSEATTSFDHYMRSLIKQRGLPHTTEEQVHDLKNTELELIDAATGPTPDDLVPLGDLIALKQAYRLYLHSIYPEQFEATTSAENTISRYLAKKRIQAEVFAILDTSDPKQAQSLWRQIKYSFVSHQLDHATFFDDNDIPVLTEQDFNQILHDTDAYVRKNFKTKNASIPGGFISKVNGFISKTKSFFNKKNQELPSRKEISDAK